MQQPPRLRAGRLCLTLHLYALHVLRVRGNSALEKSAENPIIEEATHSTLPLLVP